MGNEAFNVIFIDIITKLLLRNSHRLLSPCFRKSGGVETLAWQVKVDGRCRPESDYFFIGSG